MKAGTVAVAGVAWHQHVGISGVQVRVDDGEFRDAELGAVRVGRHLGSVGVPLEGHPRQAHPHRAGDGCDR